MKLKFFSPALAGFFIVLGGCFDDTQKLANAPVVKVNSRELSSKIFASLVGKELKKYDPLIAKNPLQIDEVKNKIIRDFIIQSLILKEIDSQNLKIPLDKIKAQMDSMRAQYPDDIALRKALAEENISLYEWEENIKFKVMEEIFFESLMAKASKPDELEIKNFYEKNKDRFKHAEKILIQQIILDEEGRLDSIEKIAKKDNFSDLVKKYSIGADRKSEIPSHWIEKGTVSFFERLFEKPIQSIQRVKSPYGYHLVFIEKKMAAGYIPLEEAKSVLIKDLLSQRQQALFISWLDKSLRRNRVFKDTQLINSMRVETVQ